MLGPTLLGGVMYRSEDLAPLMAPPADSGVIRGGQGVVVEWDADTGTNIIRYRGTDLHNVPIVRSNNEVLSLKPGDVVLLNIIGTGPFATVYIVGQVTRPGPEVAAAIRAGVATGFFTASVSAFETLAQSGWHDLATLGPSLSSVPVGESGKALIIVGCEMGVGGPSAFPSSRYAGMSFEARDSLGNVATSDVGTLVPSGNRALELQIPASADTDVIRVTASSPPILVTGLAPGEYTFTAKYSSTAGFEAQFGDRNITVIAL